MSADFRAAIRPPSSLSPPEWMARHVRVMNSERAAFFDIEQTPWWREPLELAADNSVHEIVILAPTGSGKSTVAEGLCPYIVSEDPGPFLYASQTDPDAKFWVESRALPAMKACDVIKHLWPNDKSKSRKTEILWPHMPMVFGGANFSNFQEKSIRWGYGDEVWAWNPGLVREFLGRHHNRWNRRFYLVSQGGEVGGELDIEWDKTDKAEWSWCCPECGHRQPYGRHQVKFDKVLAGGVLDHQASADTARVACDECKHEFPDTALNRRTLTNSAEYVPTSGGLTGYRGFHVHALAVWWVPWSEYVLELLAAKQQLDLGDVTRWRQLRQKRDALPWNDSLAIERREAMVSTRGKDDVEKDPAARLDGETHRVMTIDKGGDHFWAVVRAWGAGRFSTQLFEGYVASRGGNEPDLRAIQERFGVPAQHVFLDVGYEMDEAIQLCADNGWSAVKGEGERKHYLYTPARGRSVERLFSTFNTHKGSRGTTWRYVLLASDPIKDILWRLMNGKGIRWEVLPDASKAYKNHMKAEVRKEVPIGKRKQLSHHWETVNRQNHLRDCEYYQVAAALMLGLLMPPRDEEN